MSTSKKPLAIILVLALVGALGAYFYLRHSHGAASGLLEVSGNFEVTEVELSFRLPGWVEQRPVDEGMIVHKGDLIAALDDTELKQEVALRQAALANAEAALAQLLAGSRPEEITQAKAAVDAAKADMERLKIDNERLKELYGRGVAGVQEYDNARFLYDAAAAKLKQAEDTYTLVVKGPRDELKDQARARVEQDRQALKQAQTHLGFTRLDCPLDGVVLSKNTEAGEYVAAGTPIVTVGDLKDIWLRAYVDETDMQVKLGQRATITTDAYPGEKFIGRITFISSQAEFTPKNVQTKKERVKLVYRIKISVDNASLKLKPGMPADAVIDLNSPSIVEQPATKEAVQEAPGGSRGSPPPGPHND